MNIKSVLKKITPNFLVFIRRGSLNWIVKQKEKRQIQKTQKAQILILETIRKKEKVNVIFLAMFDSIWKYDEVYRLLNNDPKFNVKVVVIPHIVNNKVQTVLYNRTLNFFKKNGYFTNSSYDEYNKSWIDIKSILNPDIVFFTLPYSFTFKKYTVDFFLDKLTCYAPYNFGNSHLLEMMHNQLFHNLLWKIFAETSTHKKYSVKYARNKGNNVVITGYPGIDKFLKNENIFLSEWKIKDSSIKKIIWAPHHTIDDNKCFLSYSSFLNYSDFFFY